MTATRCALAALLYALLIVYASTIIGPMGPNFVPIDPAEALSRLLHITYVQHGSDQRSDWMGNAGMLVPLGFLVAAWLSPGERRPVIGGIAALLLCLVFIVAVKYAQLFFPPRTVTLNYLMAQSLGAAIGVFLREAMRRPLIAMSQQVERIETLRAILWIYTAGLIGFFLTPLDFALNLEDLSIQIAKFPGSLTALGGEGRPAAVRAALALAGMAVMIPVGALLTFRSRGRVYVGRSVGAAAALGFFAMVAIFPLTCLVISASASLPAVGTRTMGIALGAWGMHWLSRQDLAVIRRRLGAMVIWGVPIYLVALAAVNGLLSSHWVSAGEAANDFYRLGLYPLFNYYIVTKPQAAKNIAAHVAMYAPIGVMIWLTAREGGGRKLAFVLAACLAAGVEAGRFFRPGLVPDVNVIVLAGLSAWAASAAMPTLWRILGTVSIGIARPIPLSPAGLAQSGGSAAVSRPIGDIEEY